MLLSVPGVDTAKALWDILYLVRIPQLQTTTITYMRAVGTYMTGNRQIDRTVAEQWTTTMLPISTMIDYYKEGAQIKIVKESDIESIYIAISEHLNAWIHQLTFGINIGNAPIDDLVAMDQFANDIYAHAKYHFKPGMAESFLTRQLEQSATFSPQNFFRPDPKAKKVPETVDGVTRINEEDPYPDRESLKDYLKAHLDTLKRWK